MFNQRNRNIAALYSGGFVGGMALVMYPAGGSLYQDADFHALTSGQFGSIFIVQTVMAVIASLATATIASRYGMKAALILGQTVVITAMVLLTATQAVLGEDFAYILLLSSSALMGFGFGMALSALNAYAYDAFPGHEDTAVTFMHIIIGVGLFAGPSVLGQFINADMWWGGPAMIGVLLAAFTFFEWTQPLKLSTEVVTNPEAIKGKLTFRLGIYVLLVLFYGASEATFSNWSTTFLDNTKGYSTSEAALGLSIFWFCITAGRLIFALTVKRLNTRLVYLMSPILVTISFILLPMADTLILSYLALAMAGLSLSFFFPYTISLASSEHPTQTAFVSGVLVAGIQFGIGGSTSSVGALNDAGVFDLPTLLTLSAIYGVLMMVAVVYLNASKPLSVQQAETESLYPPEPQGGVAL